MNATLDPSVQFLGAHAQTLLALTRLRLLAQTAQTMCDEQKSRLATDLTESINHGILQHHGMEEDVLFPDLLARSPAGRERELVELMINRLVDEHRTLEGIWAELAPALAAIERGEFAMLPVNGAAQLAEKYNQHMRFEETVVLPLADRLFKQPTSQGPDRSVVLRHNVADLHPYI